MIAIPKLLLLWTVVFMLIWALCMLLQPKYIIGMVEKMVKAPEISFLFGLILFVISFLYFLVYVKLDGTWYMLFSILGYLYAFKGILMMVFPKFGEDKSKLIYGKISNTRAMGVFLSVVSLFILWVALVKF